MIIIVVGSQNMTKTTGETIVESPRGSKVERTLVSVLQPVQRSHLCEYNLLILPYPFHSDICPAQKN